MKYNLTESQKELARWIVTEVRSGHFPESFRIQWYVSGAMIQGATPAYEGAELRKKLERGALKALAEAKLLLIDVQMASTTTGSTYESSRQCTLTALAYSAVDSGFAEEESVLPISSLAQPHPLEIAISLDRLRAKYSDPKKLGFLVMRFTAAKPFSNIVEVIKKTGKEHGLVIVRADEHEFHGDLWGNVRTHLHGCGFGIAVYERIESNEPNANVGLEVGYLMAMNKPVLLLKDKTVPALQADLAGKLYKNFDPHDPAGTIPEQMTKWLVDNGIIVPKHG